MENINILKVMQSSKILLKDPMFILHMDGSVIITGFGKKMEYSSIDLFKEKNDTQSFNTDLVIRFLKSIKTDTFTPFLFIVFSGTSENALQFSFLIDAGKQLVFYGVELFEQLFPVNFKYYSKVNIIQDYDKLNI